MITFFLVLGIIGVALSAVFLGVTSSSSRGDYYSETNAHHNFRTKVALYAGAIGIIGFGAAGLLYYVF
ncbi:hypothetical protein Pryu01_00928 [Paraliobacillus ryukyuensis]|uniref:Immunity protein 17 of polymorphic toxin system n=1 Tax=Paraliobacillus ryukyuensis TaxID=200904 RepID=A0A366EFI7_9BACI|nr:hypothetical protein [Paraliobacillus ryukyuensis]RBP00500.1 hypothetical protein DES48_102264 [Paraliobacillus ryukyuensis]